MYLRKLFIFKKHDAHSLSTVISIITERIPCVKENRENRSVSRKTALCVKKEGETSDKAESI